MIPNCAIAFPFALSLRYLSVNVFMALSLRYLRAMTEIRNIVILTGAGISAESGIDTFRDAGGLWERHRVEDVATPEGFARDPDLVLGFYDMRREALAGVEPNAAHTALARLDAEFTGELLIVTQNVDDLHERAGARRVLHMHGELKSALCTSCEMRSPWDAALSANDEGQRPPCPVCQAPALRPDVVWFGEMPYQMERIYRAIREADLFVSIGTSGAVYPAAGFVRDARDLGAQTLELNLERSEGSHWFHESRQGRAGELVPRWVDEVLGS
jgi:NAD-dependent deacetylase